MFCSDSHLHLDGLVWVVPNDLEVLAHKGVDLSLIGVDPERLTSSNGRGETVRDTS